MLYAFVAGALLALVGSLLKAVFVKSSRRQGEEITGVVATELLEEVLLLQDVEFEQPCRLEFFRQSGNCERSIVVNSRREAIREATKLFRRLREPSVRIWKNEEKFADLRRPYGSARGRNEGRKLWGVTIELLP